MIQIDCFLMNSIKQDFNNCMLKYSGRRKTNDNPINFLYFFSLSYL